MEVAVGANRRRSLRISLDSLGSLPQAERVLTALRRYLRAEQKEQRHTLRHYQHVAAVDPEKAQQMRFQVQACFGTQTPCKPRLLSQTPFSLKKNVTWMRVLLACVSVHHFVPGLRGGQKRVLRFLELALQTVVSPHEGEGN